MKLLLQARIRGYDGQSRRLALRHTARVCLRTSRLRVPVSRPPPSPAPYYGAGEGGGRRAFMNNAGYSHAERQSTTSVNIFLGDAAECNQGRSQPLWSRPALVLTRRTIPVQREVWSQRRQVIRYERTTCVVPVLLREGFWRCGLLPPFAIQRA